MTVPASSPVELRVPAEDAQVSLVRTVAATVAARLDFTVEEIEDLRVVVSEACALLLSCSGSGSALHARFTTLSDDGAGPGVRTTLTLSDPGHTEFDEDSFAWQVLTALAPDVTRDSGADTLVLSLTTRGSVPA